MGLALLGCIIPFSSGKAVCFRGIVSTDRNKKPKLTLAFLLAELQVPLGGVQATPFNRGMFLAKRAKQLLHGCS